MTIIEIRPHGHRGVDLISDSRYILVRHGRLRCNESNEKAVAGSSSALNEVNDADDDGRGGVGVILSQEGFLNPALKKFSSKCASLPQNNQATVIEIQSRWIFANRCERRISNLRLALDTHSLSRVSRDGNKSNLGLKLSDSPWH
jgi:hypothetical protein